MTTGSTTRTFACLAVGAVDCSICLAGGAAAELDEVLAPKATGLATAPLADGLDVGWVPPIYGRDRINYSSFSSSLASFIRILLRRQEALNA